MTPKAPIQQNVKPAPRRPSGPLFLAMNPIPQQTLIELYGQYRQAQAMSDHLLQKIISPQLFSELHQLAKPKFK